MPLGANVKTVYRETKVILGPNDTLAFYTDGIEDMESEAGEQYGDKRVENFFLQNHALPPAEQQARLIELVRVFAGKAPAADDTTMVVLQRAAHVEPLPVQPLRRPVERSIPRADLPLAAATGPLSSEVQLQTRPLGPVVPPNPL